MPETSPPFTLTVTVSPETLYYDAVVLAELTMPDGKVFEQEMLFNSQQYVYEFESGQIGKYAKVELCSADNKEDNKKG